MPPNLIALIWLPCASVLHQSALSNETVAFACPATVHYVYDTAPQPEAAASVGQAEATKPVAAKKAAPHKRKYHHHRRRK